MTQTALLEQCQSQWYLQVPDEAVQASFCVTISKREKVGAQQVISYMGYLIMADMSFS